MLSKKGLAYGMYQTDKMHAHLAKAIRETKKLKDAAEARIQKPRRYRQWYRQKHRRGSHKTGSLCGLKKK